MKTTVMTGTYTPGRFGFPHPRIPAGLPTLRIHDLRHSHAAVAVNGGEGLLLLTGCRPGEIRCLRWCEVKPDRLALIDAKTGPRHVLLGEAARELLAGLAVTACGE